jgi:hypothetical protein
MRNKGNKDSCQRGLLLPLPLPGQVIELLSWLARDNQSSGRFAYLAPLVGGECAVLRACETRLPKLAPACATQPLACSPYTAKRPLSQGQDANDHAGRAGLDGETDAKWSLSEDHVSAVE